MSDLSISPVRTEAENQAFLRLPWRIYQCDQNWTPPLWKEHIHFFDPEHNPELQQIEMQKFVAWNDGGPAGTIIAHIHHAYNDFHKSNVGWFGQFEVIDNLEVANALLGAAVDWVRARGVDAILGPATYSVNSEIGLQIDGFEHPPMVLTTYAKPYYKDFIEAFGFQKEIDMYCWYFEGKDWGGRNADKLPEKLVRVVEKVRQKCKYTIRPVDMKHFGEEADRINHIFHEAWSKNWGFIPMSEDQAEQLKEELKTIIDREMVFVVEHEGEIIAFAAPLPDIYRPLRKANCQPGEPHWLQLLRLIWHWKLRRDVESVRVWGLGVIEEYRGTGVDALMYYEMIKKGLERGYVDVEMSWILENNDMMNRAAEMLGARVYKTYRVYKMGL